MNGKCPNHLFVCFVWGNVIMVVVGKDPQISIHIGHFWKLSLLPIKKYSMWNTIFKKYGQHFNFEVDLGREKGDKKYENRLKLISIPFPYLVELPFQCFDPLYLTLNFSSCQTVHSNESLYNAKETPHLQSLPTKFTMLSTQHRWFTIVRNTLNTHFLNLGKVH